MTLLADGRVLGAGGAGDTDVATATSLATAEIYDPATKTWSDVAAMHDARQDATATLLDNGDVLVAGGINGAGDQLSSAERYDPSTDTWTATGSLGEARDSATATALPNGDVLVAGGIGAARAALASAERYHLDADGTGAWHPAASMAGARADAAAALLEDGTVLVTGGKGPAGDVLATAEDYDPDVNAWTNAGPMAAGRMQHTLTALTGGRALVVGGNGTGGHDIGIAGVERFSTAATTLTNVNFGGVLVGTSSDVANAGL